MSNAALTDFNAKENRKKNPMLKNFILLSVTQENKQLQLRHEFFQAVTEIATLFFFMSKTVDAKQFQCFNLIHELYTDICGIDCYKLSLIMLFF